MRVTIFGATGLLGKTLMRVWAGDELTGLGSKDADIRHAKRVATVVEDTMPDWIVLAAAYTDVDGCETHRDAAFDVNCRGAENVARAARDCGSRLLFLSTDYVFDGASSKPYETSDPTRPLSVYGQSKAEAETRLRTLMPDCCVVRTSWLFGTGGKGFPDTILRLASSRPSIEVVEDQRGCPTYTVDLAQIVAELCRRGASGIVHATNEGECTRFELAEAIVSAVHGSAVLRPITSDQAARPARRPHYSVLSPASLHRFGLRMPAWQDALSRYLQERNSALIHGIKTDTSAAAGTKQ